MRTGKLRPQSKVLDHWQLLHESDFEDTDTKLLLHLDNNITDFAQGLTVSPFNITYSSTVWKFTTHSAIFNGTTSYMTVPGTSDWNFGTGSFTIDAWVYWTSFADNTYKQIVTRTDGADYNNRWQFLLRADGATRMLNFYSNNGGVQVIDVYSTNLVTEMTANTWHHVAAVRNGSDWRVYFDGVNVSNVTYTSSATMPTLTSDLQIGRHRTAPENYFSGNMDEVRIVKGTAKWTANFTPPTAPYLGRTTTYPITKDRNTVLMISGEGVDTGTSVIDECGKTITCNLGAQIGTTQKKYGVSSAVFGRADKTLDDESFDSIAAWNDSDNGAGVSSQATFDGKSCLKLDSGVAAGLDDWSARNQDIGTFGTRSVFSFKIYYSNLGTIANLDYVTFIASNGTIRCDILFDTNGAFIYDGAVFNEIGTDLAVQNTWQEWTLDVNWTGQTVDVYKDGTKVATAMDCSYATGLANGFVAFSANGYTVSNVTAYIDWFQAGATNAGYLSLAYSKDWYFGTQDFTVDFWVRFNDLTNFQTIVSQYEDASNFWHISKQDAASGNRLRVYFYDGGGWMGRYDMTDAWSGCAVSTWYHITIVRSTTTCKIFINGVSQTLTESNAFGTNNVGDISGVLSIGSFNAAYYLNGWLDDIRISKGIARWTSDFTPPLVTTTLINGDTDEEYKLGCVFVNGQATNASVGLRNNNDAGSNYGQQEILGQSTTLAAGRSTLSNVSLTEGMNGLATQAICDLAMYAKSGYVRTLMVTHGYTVSGTTVTGIVVAGWSWNNSTAPIAAMSLTASQTNALGLGTKLLLYRKVQ